MTRRNKNNILLSWSYSRPPRLSLDLPTLPPIVFTMIHSFHLMLWRYPRCPYTPSTPSPAGGMRGRPSRARVLLGPLVSSKESKVKFKSCRFEFQRHVLWLNDFFSSQVPSLKFHLFHRPVPHLSKGLRTAAQSAKFLQFSF